MSKITEDFKQRASLLRSGGAAGAGVPATTAAGAPPVPPKGPTPPVALGAQPPVPNPQGRVLRDMGAAQRVDTPRLAGPTPPAAPPKVPPVAAGGAATPPTPPAGKPGFFRDAFGLKGAAALGGVVGAADSLADLSNGYREEFQKSTGLDGIGGDVLRTLGNVGNAITFGGAERLGQGIANLTSGGSFVDGLLTPNARDRFAAGRERTLADLPAATPGASATTLTSSASGGGAGGVAPGSAQQTRLREMGVSDAAMAAAPLPEGARTLRERGTRDYQKLGTYGGSANLYGRASDPQRPGRMNDFAGVGAGGAAVGNSGDNYYVSEGRRLLAEDAANRRRGTRFATADGELGSPEQRWGAMERDLRERFGRREDSHLLARGLQRLNEARAEEMGSADSNRTLRRGQDLELEARMYDSDSRAQSSALRNQTLRDNAELNASARLEAARTRAGIQQQKIDAAASEKGYNRYTQAVDQMFTGVGEDGKPMIDTAERNRFLAFVQGSDPRTAEAFATMGAQEQMDLLQEMRVMYDMNKARNAAASSSLGGSVTNRMTRPSAIREAAFSDVANNNLPFSDYVWSNLPGTNEKVVVDDTGQAVLLSDIATDENGNWDVDKEAILSRLRRPQ